MVSEIIAICCGAGIGFTLDLVKTSLRSVSMDTKQTLQFTGEGHASD